MVITKDDRPLRYYVDRLVHTIQARRRMSLREIVEQSTEGESVDKRVMIGTFCALLELVKIGVCTARQGSAGDDIDIVLRDEVGNDLESIVRLTEFDDEKAADEAALAQDAPNPAPAPAKPSTFASSVFDDIPEDEPPAAELEVALPEPLPPPQAPDYDLTRTPPDA
jgi:hypothetical protein